MRRSLLHNMVGRDPEPDPTSMPQEDDRPGGVKALQG